MPRIPRFHRCAVALAGLTLASVGCKNDDDKDDGGNTSSNTSSSSWLVGEEGEMLRLGAAGDVTPYPLAEDADLLAIACVGTASAWVVGSAGAVLSTDDAGATWQRHELGVTSDLTSVAATEAHSGGQQTVVIAGDDGVVLSRHGDGEFTRVPGPALDWTAIATDESGDQLLLASDDGTLWRSDSGGRAYQLYAADDAVFHGLSSTYDGKHAVAVGSGGLVVLSDDAGASWTPVAVPTARDLFAARISKDGTEVLAVGEAGVVVKIDPSGVSATEQLDPALALHGVHLHHTGAGHAVGDAGIVLFTPDVGNTWTALETGTDAVLRGVDDVHLGVHW